MVVKSVKNASSTTAKSEKKSDMDQESGVESSGPRESSIDPNDPEFQRFASNRGFDPNWLAELGMGRADSEAVGYAGQWVGIPYLHKTGQWYTRYRRIDFEGHGPKYLSPPGATPRLYNPLHCGPDADYVWFCEGEFNALALVNLGLNAVAIGGASNWKNHWTTLFESATVLVGYDNDPAGKQNALMTANQFKDAYIFEKYPDGVNDFNEWMVVDKEQMMEVVYGFMSKHGVG